MKKSTTQIGELTFLVQLLFFRRGGHRQKCSNLEFFVGFGEEVEEIPYMVMIFSKIVYGVQDLAEKILLECLKIHMKL
jgi:hypothetical protein